MQQIRLTSLGSLNLAFHIRTLCFSNNRAKCLNLLTIIIQRGDANSEEDAGFSPDGEKVSSERGALLLSWSVGVAFGRFDVRLATGEREMPSDPGPFDPLPAKSPGMLRDNDPPFMPCDGVLVDDEGEVNDFMARVAAVYDCVGELAGDLIVLRRTLARDFFAAHIKMYSKNRRKAPIYWQLATPSVSYSVWLYVHAFTKDTLFRVQNDYSPKNSPMHSDSLTPFALKP